MKKTPRKILFVITKSVWGGAGKYVFDLATSLKDEGFPVSVALGGDGELITKLQEKDIPVIILTTLRNDMNILKSLVSLMELYRIFRKEKPDIIHLNSSKIGLFGAIAGKLARVKTIIFTSHGWVFNEDRTFLSKNILRKLMQFTVLICKKTICVSKSTKTTLFAPSWLEKKCTVIHNGIANITFKEPDAFFEERGITRKEHLALISIGELHKSKGFDLALNHLAKLTHLSWEWHIMGEGNEREALEKQIRALALQDRVFLHGYVKEASTYLTSFDMFLLPSRTEALAYVALEAIQSNLPIIASAVGGIPEVLRRDPGTTFITIKDENAYKVIEKTLRNKSILLNPVVRDSIRKEFSLAHMVKETKRMYSL